MTTEIKNKLSFKEEAQLRGNDLVFGSLVHKIKFKPTKDNKNEIAYITVAIINESKVKESQVFTKFISLSKDAKKSNQQSMHKFLSDLNPGQLLSIEYSESNGFKNIYTIFPRKSKKSNVAKPKINNEIAAIIDDEEI